MSRTPIATTPISPSFTPSADVWYPDGTAILVAEGEAFRVYSGMLARQSPVFADMFALPQPPGSEDTTYEGCPVVYMADSASEMRIFLRILHDGRYAPCNTGSTSTSWSLTSHGLNLLRSDNHSMLHNLDPGSLPDLLRISTKYGVTYLRNLAIASLHYYFPLQVHRFSDMAQTRTEKMSIGQLFYLANVCRETQAVTLLVLVLCCCAHLELKYILYGVSPTAASFSFDRAPLSRIMPHSSLDPTSHEELDPANKRLVMHSRHHLCRLARLKTYHIVFFGPKHGDAICKDASAKLARRLLAGSPDDGFVSPFIGTAQADTMLSFCAKCKQEFRTCTEKGMAAAWETLPGIYEQGSWEKKLQLR
ncbi:hypothetical protein EIP91_007498 [Steccherinum ochraceum]|uniref:BTB domain-containing protein n=1 Tax=Steccherinum ochraceum TaxID=92696 RepID=A0A4R0R6K1_9APHY|nr:hypothetical protein EIP91_007498 [Steccherinum ochraceum]